MRSTTLVDDSPSVRILTSLAERIAQEHDLACSHARKAIEHARNAGELLIEAKSQVAHGEWQPWLAINFQGSVRSAQAYMQIANGWEKIAKAQTSAVLSIDGALKLLRSPAADKPIKTPTGLGELPEPVQVYLRSGDISEGHACQLFRLRDVYLDLSADLTHWKNNSVEFDFDDPHQVWQLLHYGVRPENCPVCLFGRLLKNDDPGVLSDGCEAFIQLMEENDFVLPQWWVSAFWWASFVADLPDITPIQLGDGLLAWRDRFDSAILHLLRDKKEPTLEDCGGDKDLLKRESKLWWGHRSDLRHSNALSVIGGNYPEITIAAIDRVMDCGSVVAPSSRQPWSLNFDEDARRYAAAGVVDR